MTLTRRCAERREPARAADAVLRLRPAVVLRLLLSDRALDGRLERKYAVKHDRARRDDARADRQSSTTSTSRFGDVEVLKGISFDVAKGERRLHHRPVGLGQVDAAALHQRRSLPIDRGSIRVGDSRRARDQNRPARSIALRKDVSIVFQQYNLFPHKTALENIMMAPIHVLKQDQAEVEARAHRAAQEGAARRQGRRSIPGELRAASSSAWRSPARSRCGPQ